MDWGEDDDDLDDDDLDDDDLDDDDLDDDDLEALAVQTKTTKITKFFKRVQ